MIFYHKVIKRIFDIVTALTGLIVLFPLFVFIAILIKARMPGPVLFKQKRAGRQGKSFTIFKFRTMVQDHYGGPVSVRGESRITTLGATLRRYKLDELPELWNVFIGDMSMVGPRPDLPEYAFMLKGEERKILDLRPGITGPASIKYKNEEELLASVPDPKKYNDEVIWPDKVKMNLDYYHHMSLIIDIGIIFRTFFGDPN